MINLIGKLNCMLFDKTKPHIFYTEDNSFEFDAFSLPHRGISEPFGYMKYEKKFYILHIKYNK